MKTTCIRQGDLVLKKIDKLPEGLELAKTLVMMRGSHGHDHYVDTGKIYFKKENTYVIGYLVAKNSTLDHPEHGGMKLTNGVYEIRKQQEFTPAGLVPVID